MQTVRADARHRHGDDLADAGRRRHDQDRLNETADDFNLLADLDFSLDSMKEFLQEARAGWGERNLALDGRVKAVVKDFGRLVKDLRYIAAKNP